MNWPSFPPLERLMIWLDQNRRNAEAALPEGELPPPGNHPTPPGWTWDRNARHCNDLSAAIQRMVTVNQHILRAGKLQEGDLEDIEWSLDKFYETSRRSQQWMMEGVQPQQ